MDTPTHARMRTKLSNAALIVCLLFLQACASSSAHHTAKMQFYSGQPERALETLKEVDSGSKNRLLVLFDKGSIAFAAGQYRESSRALLQASKLLEELDVISISEQSTSLIANDWVTTYRGEYSERLWVHALQMMNFLLLDEAESAAVEARQAIKLLDTYPDALKEDWFTRALIGMSFEAVGQLDSAHIEYSKLYDDAKYSDGISQLAWNNAKRLGRQAAMLKMANGRELKSFDSAIVLFINAGRIPSKLVGNILIDTDQHIAFPIYPAYPAQAKSISVAINGEAAASKLITTNLITVARASLAERGKKIAAKSIVRAATKNAIAKKARKEDSLLGAFITAALYISELPDLRSWETLPGQLSMVVLPVNPGTHTISVEVGDGSSSDLVTLNDINVERGQRVFRTLHQPSAAPLTIPVAAPTPAPAN